ncbi:ribosome biogenesis/translation initiation ATPase RLI [Candidatus Woesearchaeota archaeon CG10_big_fil_rev_8_21_14_0_10_37_12]|nr:MAG: ribosome biogenesis/translation initiation ATPase RLI [Candidatus Woesearchaeota archaeon CG10_big_fil_rev_8_21_14_0_10_37_12]
MPRIAIIRKERCNPQGCGGYLCARVCPINMEGQDCIVKGPDTKPIINEELCTGCGICPNRCPFDAIDIINLPDKLEHPIHRYGRNGFHLYSLPTPVFGKVVGIVGRNGIGKSTAIKILAGIMKPNLGKDEEATWQKLVEHFKGKEAQTYFEAVRDGKITVSYKPQHVEMIPKTTTGTVKELLKKVDERNAFDEVTKTLNLNKVLDRDIKQVSGGELQRIAIAATALRKANFYIFDEPTSYLDIKQRINVSKFIKELANEQTAVLVVEHDLIILDYMTDLLHITYGKSGSYGIVSLPKQTRTGMNTYLEGYIRDENMRFRDKKIEFIARPPRPINKLILTEWKPMELKLGDFKLNVSEGKIGKSTIIGVVGENGIGKTTFVKALAGEITTNEKLNNITVAYKPQYLQDESDEFVNSFLVEAISKYQTQLIEPLELKHLLNKPLKTLSGGELQRVYIAKCLSQEAELFLLDEPSAYLDIEQRLTLSKVVRDLADQRDVSILIVDHDLLFLDYISDKITVFEGEPAKQGSVTGPFEMEQGMNKFLTSLNITLRRDKESKRPRINKEGSVLDREQRSSGKLYYG